MNAAKNVARRAGRISKRVIASYVVDWIFIIVIAGVGAVFNRLHRTTKRPFVLQDPSISYPYKPDTVTPTVLVIISLVAPAVITFLLCFIPISTPAPHSPSPSTTRAQTWRRSLWSWNTAWMGLALSLATAFAVTEGLKDLAGKPRPHTLAVCNPNLDLISQYQVGGLGTQLNGGAVPIMVDFGICRETDPQKLRDTFASWPSGHSSFSFAGLLYLTLFLASKFAVTIPYIAPQTLGERVAEQNEAAEEEMVTSARTEHEKSTSTLSNNTNPLPVPHSSLATTSTIINPHPHPRAAPPVPLVIITLFPTLVAIFVCVSRWFDYHHHGIDILTGAVLGAITAWSGFRLYHPGRRGWWKGDGTGRGGSGGGSWGARVRGAEFGIRLGGGHRKHNGIGGDAEKGSAGR